MRWLFLPFLYLFYAVLAHADFGVWNNPYPKSEALQRIYYSSFSQQPKTLDIARSYSSNEYMFVMQIYEPLLGYDYFARPYELVPLNAHELPKIKFLDKEGALLPPQSATKPTYTVYTIQIKKGILYQPHPALAKNKQGVYQYHHLAPDYLDDEGINSLSDFQYSGTREMLADDYIYQIKRLANPNVSSPIYGLLSDYILGFKEYGALLPKNSSFIDLRKYPLEGVKKIDDYTFEITLKKQYSQFLFWLAMPFFSPIPWEADLFYAQSGMDDKNLSLDWYPIGTGPFMLTENNPNRQMILEKNPNFRQEYFPVHGQEADKKQGYLVNRGKRLPMIDKALFTLEKETIPRWNKFLQGYYDISSVGPDSFEEAIQIDRFGVPVLSPEMKNKKIDLTRTLEPSIYYMGFNMLDPIVGGNSPRARKLRQAISIAVNYEEHIAIFYNGRGLAAQGPIPPGIFGYKEGQAGLNPWVYQWTNEGLSRRPLSDAKQLMSEAGYPGGIDPATGDPLILHYDAIATGSPSDKAIFDWMRKQFAKLGIDLNIRATLYNRFQEKMRVGDAQLFSWGWNADYPDPENFLFQLYGPNGKVHDGGENAANYQNPKYDALFDLMKNRDNDDKRQELIDKMLDILRYDSPWVWGIIPENLTLSQAWVSKIKPNTIALGTLKYMDINVLKRNQLRDAWNKPILWPLGVLMLIVLALILPTIIAYQKMERKKAPRLPL